MSLREYHRKRDFTRTAEPKGGGTASRRGKQRRFVIQKHDASRLHYDFRLELNRTLVSWAVPKGLPLKKGEKHLAVKVEDHPLSYIDFEGTIPRGQYGGGTVQVWDRGTYEAQSRTPMKDIKGGKLHVRLRGSKLAGDWYLVRLRDGDQWLIIKAGGDHKKVGKAHAARSALSGMTLSQIARSHRDWNSGSRTVQRKPKPAKTRRGASSRTVGGNPAAAFIPPMMARLTDQPPLGEWSYEIKFDGYRALACKQGDTIRLLSRTNHDLTDKFPEVAEAVSTLRVDTAIVDGEIVALDKTGRSSFQLLQSYELGEGRPSLCYYVFDLLRLGRTDVTDLPLRERREKLRGILPARRNPQVLRFSATLGSDAASLLEKARSLGLEGLIGKRAQSVYEAGKRTGTWIKLKIVREQEFVIGGYTEPGGARKHFGALLVGVYEKGKLTYAGKVGTGFSEAVLEDLAVRFESLARKTCPFHDLPETRRGRHGQGITAAVMKRCHWLKPLLVCQVRFSEWTAEARLRQPAYLGLREDKNPKRVVREEPVRPS